MRLSWVHEALRSNARPRAPRKAVGLKACAVPQDRFPEFVAWLLLLLGPDDRENMTGV